MLPLPQATPLPTSESFIAQRTDEFASSNVQHVKPLLDELHLEMEASRLDANYRHSNQEEADLCLYNWACQVLRYRMGREMDEVEQPYVREKCR